MYQEFHRKLITDNSRPLGPSSSSRLSATSSESSILDLTSTGIKVPNRSDQTDHSRGTGTLKQRCHQFGPGQHRGFHIPDIYRLQNRRRIPSNNKPEAIEQSHSRGTLQDGGVPYGKRIDQTTRLACKGRSKRLVPIHLNHRKYL